MNKLALITGANSGIGLATAEELAKKNYDLILWCRSQRKGEEARAHLQALAPNVRMELVVADLGNLVAVRQAAQELVSKYSRLDVLINNAGYIPESVTFTPDGIETTFYASHLGHFVLTQTLRPLLEKGNDPRIVTVSSMAHAMGDANRFFTKHNANTMSTYGDAKLANILFTMGLRTHYANTGIRAYTLHPGVVRTGFGLNTGWFFRTLVKLGSWVMISPNKGAQTSVYLASTPTADIPNGLYFDKCKPRSTANKTITDANAEALWQRSQAILDALP